MIEFNTYISINCLKSDDILNVTSVSSIDTALCSLGNLLSTQTRCESEQLQAHLPASALIGCS